MLYELSRLQSLAKHSVYYILRDWIRTKYMQLNDIIQSNINSTKFDSLTALVTGTFDGNIGELKDLLAHARPNQDAFYGYNYQITCRNGKRYLAIIKGKFKLTKKPILN